MDKLGFRFSEAGLTVITKHSKVYTAFRVLESVLGAGMVTQIPHYLLSLKYSTKSSDAFPSHFSRTIISSEDGPGGQASIVREFIVDNDIYFIDKSPYFTFNYELKESNRHGELFVEEIKRRTGGEIKDANVAILAGVARNSQDVLEKITGKKSARVAEVKHGSTVISLARIAMALVDWSSGKKSDQPLFIISTTRLINEIGEIPQAYSLNKIFLSLGLKPEWLGLCISKVREHRGNTWSYNVRENFTEAVLVEIKPEQREEALKKIKEQFNQAVEKMIKENTGLF